MSSTSSQELADSVSASNEQECGPSRFVKSTRSVGASSPSTGQMSDAITIFEKCPSSKPISSAEDSLVSPSAPLLEAGASQPIFGQKCSGLSDATDQDSSSQKMYRKRQSPRRLETSPDLITQRTTAVYRGLIAGLTIKEIVGGLLHTPTRKANFIAPSMQKWPSCRRYVLAFGGQRITRAQFEYLNGFPVGWTDLEPLEMPSFRKSPKPSGEQS